MRDGPRLCVCGRPMQEGERTCTDCFNSRLKAKVTMRKKRATTARANGKPESFKQFEPSESEEIAEDLQDFGISIG